MTSGVVVIALEGAETADISKWETMGSWLRIIVTKRSNDSGRFLKLEYRHFLEMRFNDLSSSHRKMTPSRVTTIMCRESQVIEAIRSVSSDSANNAVCCLCFAGIWWDRLPHAQRKHLLWEGEECWLFGLELSLECLARFEVTRWEKRCIEKEVTVFQLFSLSNQLLDSTLFEKSTWLFSWCNHLLYCFNSRLLVGNH